MKATSFLLLALGAASASACDNYYYCYCLDDNGIQDDYATGRACAGYPTAHLIDGPAAGYHQCTAIDAGTVLFYNCYFEEACQDYYSASADCWDREHYGR